MICCRNPTDPFNIFQSTAFLKAPRLFFVIAICPICKTMGIRLITIGLSVA